MRCFLSYATEDRTTAQHIAEHLRFGGHRCFFDRSSLAPGDAFDDRIRDEIQRADLFIFLVSPHSVAPGRYTRTELNVVRERWRWPRGRVLPVEIVETPLESWPVFLTLFQVLQNEGNVVAEVVNEVHRRSVLRRRRTASRAGALVLALSASAGLAWKALHSVPVASAGRVSSGIQPPAQPPERPGSPVAAAAPVTAALAAPPARSLVVAASTQAAGKPFRVRERPKATPSAPTPSVATVPTPPILTTASITAPDDPASRPPLPALKFFDTALMVPADAGDLARADDLARAGQWHQVVEQLERIMRQRRDPRLNLAMAQLYAVWDPRAYAGVIESEIAKAGDAGPLTADLLRVVTSIRHRAEMGRGAE
jgi:hypothetical protein